MRIDTWAAGNEVSLWDPMQDWSVDAYRWLQVHVSPEGWSALGTWATALIALVTVVVAGRYAKRQVTEARRQVAEAQKARLSQEKHAQDALASQTKLANEALIKQAQLAQETLQHDAEQAQLNRKHAVKPDVVVYIARNDVHGYFDLVVKNFGQTAAYNVRMTLPPLPVAPYRNKLDGKEVTHVYVPENIAVLAPGQEWRTMWDSYERRVKYEKRMKHEVTLETQFEGRVDFDDKLGVEKGGYWNPISLDTNMFWNTMSIERSSNKSVEDALYDIAGTLEKFGEEHKGVWVYHGPGEREHHRREEEHEQWLRDQEQFERDIGFRVDSPPDDKTPDDTDGPEDTDTDH